MPIYSYICDDDHIEDCLFAMGRAPKSRTCPFCKKKAGRYYRPPQVSVFKPYVTPHITGEPVEVRSAAHEDSLCEKNGVYRMLDGEQIDINKSKRIRERRKKEALNAVPWEKAIAQAEADHGAKLVTPDKPKKKRRAKTA